MRKDYGFMLDSATRGRFKLVLGKGGRGGRSEVKKSLPFPPTQTLVEGGRERGWTRRGMGIMPSPMGFTRKTLVGR